MPTDKVDFWAMLGYGVIALGLAALLAILVILPAGAG